MAESFLIPYPPTKAGKKDWSRRYGLNAYWSGKHWAQRKEDADFWHMLVRLEMNRQRVRRKPFEKAVKITMLFNDRLDGSNHAIYFKLIEDAMKGRVIQDDSRRWVRSCEMGFHEQDYILVKVEEVSE